MKSLLNIVKILIIIPLIICHIPAFLLGLVVYGQMRSFMAGGGADEALDEWLRKD